MGGEDGQGAAATRLSAHRSWVNSLIQTKVYEPGRRAHLGATAHLCEVVVPKFAITDGSVCRCNAEEVQTRFRRQPISVIPY